MENVRRRKPIWGKKPKKIKKRGKTERHLHNVYGKIQRQQ
jgi:hypothetical protein